MSLKYESIISKMTLEEKALMMSGKNTWQTVDFEKYGIPSMTMSDGPHGLRRQAGAGAHLGLNASLPATCFPTAATVAVDQYLKECGRDNRTGDFVVNRGQRMNLTIGIR